MCSPISTSCAAATVVAPVVLPSAAPSVTPFPAPVAATPQHPKESLARTGADVAVPLIVSSVLLAVGVVLLLWRRLRVSA